MHFPVFILQKECSKQQQQTLWEVSMSEAQVMERFSKNTQMGSMLRNAVIIDSVGFGGFGVKAL